MSKLITLLFVFLALVSSLTDKEIIQTGLNGLFEQNKLPDSKTIVPCLDDDTAHKVVVFAGQLLSKAASGSLTDLISLVDMIKKFGDDIPQSVKDCLDGNAQLAALGAKYGITPDSDPSVIQKKVITYVTLHYLEVHKFFGDQNKAWMDAKYYDVGFNGAAYAHKILGLINAINLTDKEILQTTLNGLFEQNKLPDPKTIVPCIDDDTAHKIVIFIGKVLELAAKGSPTDLNKLVDMIKKFGDQIPQAVKDCLKDNQQFEALGVKYGITPDSDPSAIQKKVLAYVALHYLEVHKFLGEENSSWKAAKYYDVGFNGATFAHKILKMEQEDIQQVAETIEQVIEQQMLSREI